MLWENRAPSFRHEGSAPRAYPSPGSWSVVCQPCPPKHPSPCNVQQMGKPLASCSCEISIRSDSQQVMFSQALHRQWHLAWCSAVLERSFVPRIELSALLAICPCKVASDLSFILPGPACRVSRPVFISVCSALLGTMLPLPPLGWVWLFQFCCTGTESSLWGYPSVLCRDTLTKQTTWDISSWELHLPGRGSEPLSRYHQCLCCHHFSPLSFP